MDALAIRKIAARPELCRNCQACMLGCSLYHDGKSSLAASRIAVDKDFETAIIAINVCRQCWEPDCIPACPTGAVRWQNGAVVIAEEECVQCGACLDACPYDSIFLAGDRYLKCDFCQGRAEGPLCVELCPVDALAVAAAEER